MNEKIKLIIIFVLILAIDLLYMQFVCLPLFRRSSNCSDGITNYISRQAVFKIPRNTSIFNYDSGTIRAIA